MMNLMLRVVLSRFRQASAQVGDDNSSIYNEGTSINEIRTLAFEKMRFEREMRKGLDQGEFELHYQPIVQLESGKIIGFEALMRWRHGEKYVSPVEFIPISEETGLIVEQGRFALETGLRDHQRFANLLENRLTEITGDRFIQPTKHEIKLLQGRTEPATPPPSDMERSGEIDGISVGQIFENRRD